MPKRPKEIDDKLEIQYLGINVMPKIKKELLEEAKEENLTLTQVVIKRLENYKKIKEELKEIKAKLKHILLNKPKDVEIQNTIQKILIA